MNTRPPDMPEQVFRAEQALALSGIVCCAIAIRRAKMAAAFLLAGILLYQGVKAAYHYRARLGGRGIEEGLVSVLLIATAKEEQDRPRN